MLKKADYNTKITEIEKKLTDYDQNKFIATPELNTLAADVINARLKQANLVVKTNFDNTVSSLIKLLPIKQKTSLLKMS